MSQTFNPLPFVFVTFGDVPESPAAVAYSSVDCFRSQIVKIAAGISPEASARLGVQWASMLDAVLLEETARMCAALRASFAGYPTLN
jgi:hypothetical protein